MRVFLATCGWVKTLDVIGVAATEEQGKALAQEYALESGYKVQLHWFAESTTKYAQTGKFVYYVTPYEVAE